MSFGTKLAAYRQRAGMKQETLAKLIGIHMQSVSDLERGKFKPGIATVARIKEALNLNQGEVNDLLADLLEEAK